MFKPCILIGNGCRNNPNFVQYLCSLNIPVLTTWQGIDLVAEDNPAYCGRPGVFGQRAANIIQSKADAMFCYGARIDGEQTAYDYSRFAPNAKKYVVDVDEAELSKFPADWSKACLDLSKATIDDIQRKQDPAWLTWCKALYQRFRPELDADPLSTYIGVKEFMTALHEATNENDLLALGSSGGVVNTFLQTYKVKAGQRITVCASIGGMGMDIPMAIGGSLASGRRTITLAGDGGFNLNTQELEVVRRLNLNIKFFVFNNNGYGSIRAMQDARFEGRHVACDPESGFTIPSIRSLSECYQIDYYNIWARDQLSHITGMLYDKSPMIVEVLIDPAWKQWPKVGSTMRGTTFEVDGMHDMTPHLPAEELVEIMAWGN